MQQLASEEQTGNVEPVINSGTMGKVSVVLEQCAIHAGTNLKGYVSIVANKSDVEEVVLKVQGSGTIRVNADNGKTYSSRENYLTDKMTIWTRTSKNEPNKGVEMKVPFEYHIAKDAQPSFDGHYAKIVYTCIGIVKYAGAFSRKQNGRFKFFVLPHFDQFSVGKFINLPSISKVEFRRAAYFKVIRLSIIM